jgi:RNA polymerase sigma-70 factor (ECF subfamily)
MTVACAVAAIAAVSHTARAMPVALDVARDEELMLAYANGDAAAFDVLYSRHKGGIYRYVLRHCGNAGLADELFQDIWMNAIRVRASYAPTAKFTTWLYTLARNRIVDHWRAKGHALLMSIDGDESMRSEVDALPASIHDEPHVRADNRELATRLKASLAALPPAQRDAFMLQHEGGLSLSEIATLTGVGAETVKSRLRYATAKLRSELGELREAFK